MGTGTGILAIAAAKAWRRCVLARDIDAEAVRVTAANAQRNGVAAFVRARRSAGFSDRALVRAAPYDVIFANILARPLAAMARGLAGRLAPGGVVILSGLLGGQEAYVLRAYRAQHLVLAARIVLDDWHTLLLRRPARSPPSSRIR
jgi:ribosomal protein L11 methyltransferase